MEVTLLNKNVVLAANDVNLSIFKPWWLIKQGIIKEDKVGDELVVSPVLIQIPTDEFQLNIFPNRIQLSLLPACNDDLSIITQVLGKIVESLPHTPFCAAGLNITYQLLGDDLEAYENWEKTFFSSSILDMCELPDDSKPRFGSYISFDIFEGRLKLTVKPIHNKQNTPASNGAEKEIKEEIKEGIHCSFNFHYDIDSQKDPTERIFDIFSKWKNAESLSENFINKLGK